MKNDYGKDTIDAIMLSLIHKCYPDPSWWMGLPKWYIKLYLWMFDRDIYYAHFLKIKFV